MNFYIITQTKKYLNIISIIIKNLNYLVFNKSFYNNNRNNHFKKILKQNISAVFKISLNDRNLENDNLKKGKQGKDNLVNNFIENNNLKSANHLK